MCFENLLILELLFSWRVSDKEEMACSVAAPITRPSVHAISLLVGFSVVHVIPRGAKRVPFLVSFCFSLSTNVRGLL